MSNGQGDVLQLIRATLLNDDAVQAECSNRIYAEHPALPDDGSFAMPCIVLDVINGRNIDLAGRATMLRMDLYAYSGTNQGDALRVYELAKTALNDQPLDLDNIDPKGTAHEIERPLTDANTRVRGFLARGSWQVFTAG